jgi:hypothetical protein
MSSFLKGSIFGAAILGVLLFLINLLFLKDEDPIINHDAVNKILIVDKNIQKISVYDSFHGHVKSFDVSTGENPGNKLMNGDLKTPEGIFPIIGIEDASDWSYDFKDGKGPVTGAYGPLFIRLKVDYRNIFYNVGTEFKFTSGKEFTGIGIHGTHLNELIGERASHGCIRLRNSDLIELKQYVQPGTFVLIIPGKSDVQENINPKFIY